MPFLMKYKSKDSIDIFGREIHSQSQSYPTGKNQIEINVLNFSAGVYFYSIEFDGKMLVRKMVVY